MGGVVSAPIVHWLRELGSGVGGFHQSVLVSVPAGVGVGALVGAVQAVVDRHDALRLRLEVSGDGGWGLVVGEVGSVSAGGCVRRVDVSGGDGGVLSELVRVEADAARERLDPEGGVMVQVVWFDAGAGRSGRLLLVVHHLVVDGVSWRVILPDLEAAWRAVVVGEVPVLEPVGTSYRAWAGLLPGLAEGRVGELGLWEGVLSGGDVLLSSRVLDPVVDVAGSSCSVSVEVPAGVTSALLTWVPGVFRAGVEEVLLAALGVAVSRWREGRGVGGGDLLVDLEGHGREQLVEGLDLSRTVGWFTSRYPVRLDVDGVGVVGAVKRVKEVLRGLPDRGVGFGLLRYLHPVAGGVLAGLPEPQVGFNYLGRFAAQGGDWSPVGEAGGVGGGVDPSMRMPHALEVNALTLDGVDGSVLSAVWAWPGGLFGEGEVEGLARAWVEVLESLVVAAGEPGAGGLTPSDVGLVEVTQGEIEVLESAYPGLVDVLPLSPLQEGLHFH
ncbi:MULTISPECIES: condensation domain-containing protein, partial [unclassified Streptomyces]|uniref:condensation domain-containing protein n=1 Tax=unclassified Streptomyces TaxID=2593676 RepID=UPI0035D6007B